MWDAEFIQFSWFSVEAGKSMVSGVFQNLFGTNPIFNQNNEIITVDNPFLSRAQGKFEDLTCEVRNDNNRVDVILKKQINENEAGEYGPFNQLLNVNSTLDKLTEKIIDTKSVEIEKISRLAVISNLTKCFNQIDAVNQSFIKLCKLPINSKNISDLHFKFNKKKEFDDLVINRLVNYSIQSIEEVAQISNGIVNNNNKKFYKINILSDFNSVPTTEIESQKQTKILELLISETKSFAANPVVTKFEEQKE